MNFDIILEALDYFRERITVPALNMGCKEFFPLFDSMYNRRIVIMPGDTNETKGVKCLYVDDYKSERKGIIYGFSNKYGSFEFDPCIITPIRTVLVTLMAITSDPNSEYFKTAEIIGYKGSIGNHLMNYLRLLNLNISGVGKNQVQSGMDIAISATSNINKLCLKPIHQNTKLVITLDAGYYFDESILSLTTYTDDCNYLNKNIPIEFPFYKPQAFEKSFLNEEYRRDFTPKAVHIVGSGLYDILLCEFCLTKGINKENLEKSFHTI